MRQMIQPLESRRLLAFDLPAGMFSQPSDTYSLTVGTLIPSLELQSIGYAMTKTVSAVNDTGFQLTAVSGASTPALFQLAVTAQPQQIVSITQKTASGATRCTWVLRGVILSNFSQHLSGAGAVDSFKLDYNDRMTWSLTRFDDAGAPVGAETIEYRRPSNQVTLTPAIVDTRYLSTSGEAAATFELAGDAPRSQMPLVGFSYSASGGAAGAQPVGFAASAGAEELRLLNRMLAGSASGSDGVYTHRDASGQVDLRWRFQNFNLSQFAMADTVGDDEARIDQWAFTPSRAQNLAYSYAGDTMNPPTAYGWDYVPFAPWTPTTISAHIAQPTSGPRNTPVNSIDIQFTSAVPSLTLSAFVFENINAAGATLATSNGGLNWTLGNLAPSQTADGDYAVKLFGYGSGITNFVGSIGKSWTLDTSGPAVTETSFGFDGVDPAPFRFEFGLSEPVQPAGANLPLLIRRVSTGALVTTVFASVSPDGFLISAPMANILADGDYTATLPAGSVRDAAGNLIATDTSLPFFILAGDVNRDRKVDFADLLALAQNYGQSNRTFEQGNVDYSADRAVNFGDLLVLAQHYGATLSVGGRGDTARNRAADEVLA